MNEVLSPLILTLKLATVTTAILLLVGIPLAWWLTQNTSASSFKVRRKNILKSIINAIVALPLILPPTVLGFYLLLAMGPQGPLGQFTKFLGVDQLSFSFTGLVVGSVLYSMPFVIQPIQNAFEAIGSRPLEVAATLRASPWDRFLTVGLPMAKPGIITAAILGFAHTIGEFGVVLMIGGNIPGRTKVLSVAIYDHVEALEYAQAHRLSFILLVFSFSILFLLYIFRRPMKVNL